MMNATKSGEEARNAVFSACLSSQQLRHGQSMALIGLPDMWSPGAGRVMRGVVPAGEARADVRPRNCDTISGVTCRQPGGHALDCPRPGRHWA